MDSNFRAKKRIFKSVLEKDEYVLLPVKDFSFVCCVSLLKFSTKVYLYVKYIYVMGHIVSSRDQVLRAPKLETAEILNNIHQCKKYIFYKVK